MTKKNQIPKKKSKIQQKKTSEKNFKMILVTIAAFVVVVAFYTTIIAKDKDKDKDSTDNSVASQGTSTIKKKSEAIQNATDEKGNLVIKLADISETPSFYGYSELGNKMEVITVKASDGSIRTAFNTCQVCFSSGRGYYELEGDVLVCQNCGNEFGVDDIEVTRGGCNPIPIEKENKIVDDTSITIEKLFFEETEEIFENWK